MQNDSSPKRLKVAKKGIASYDVNNTSCKNSELSNSVAHTVMQTDVAATSIKHAK